MAADSRKIGLLIDADNIDPKFYPEIMETLGALGTVVVRRAYGNPRTWNKKTLRDATLKHALTPVLVIPPIETKDAADMRLAIEAVDLMHRSTLDGIAIASSDSDFATLAAHIAESGIAVYGFGETKTPEAFRVACTTFTVLLQPSARRAAAPAARAPAERPAPPTERAAPPAERAAPAVTRAAPPAERHTPAERPAERTAAAERHTSAPRGRASARPPAKSFPADEVLDAFDQSVRDDGWARLGSLRTALAKRIGGFDQRHYGSAKFVSFLKQDDRFEFNEKRDAVRLKRA